MAAHIATHIATHIGAHIATFIATHIATFIATSVATYQHQAGLASPPASRDTRRTYIVMALYSYGPM